MKKAIQSLIFTFILTSIPGQSISADKEMSNEEAFNPTPYILHHIADSYEWHLWGNVSIPLPVILYTKEAGMFSCLQIFIMANQKNNERQGL